MIFAERRLKYCVRRKICNGIGAASEYDDPTWPRYVRITDIAGPRSLRADTFRSLPSEQAAEAPFDVGDLLAAAVGATFGKTYLHCVDIGPAAFAGYLVRISPSKEFDPRFVAYWSESNHYWDQVNSSFVQSTIQNFSASKYGELRLTVTSLVQQRAIADYLDRETSRIDALINAKEQLLGLLAEKRRAIIKSAITNGLDQNVPHRDTGIPWLNKIPAHWETPPLYARFEVQLGKMLDEKKIKGTHLAPYLRNIDVQWGYINVMELPEMDFNEEDRKHFALRMGDILVCEGGEIGRCAIWLGTLENCYYQKALHRLRPTTKKDLPEFFLLIMRTIVEAGEFAAQATAATIQHLPAEKLRILRYPSPPVQEQRAIVDHINRETAKLDTVLNATERSINLLRERRKTLIDAVVTGKLEVKQ